MYTRSCDECDFQTEMVIGWDSLKHHKESVHEGIVYTCKICPNYNTTNGENFRRHNKNRHSKKERKVYTEDKCSYQTSSNVRHKEVVHEGILHHRCDFMNCSYGTSRKRELKNHMVQHTGTYPFYCDACKKGFVHSGSLARHIVKHTDINKKHLLSHTNHTKSRPNKPSTELVEASNPRRR